MTNDVIQPDLKIQVLKFQFTKQVPGVPRISWIASSARVVGKIVLQRIGSLSNFGSWNVDFGRTLVSLNGNPMASLA